MGILFQAVHSQTERERKRQYLLDQLKNLKIFYSNQGVSIELLGYKELKHELTLASLRND